MNLNKTTRYGLYAAMEMVRADDGEPVTVAEVAERYGISEGVLAKVFQQLVRFRLAVGTRGVGGGYRLTRPPGEVTVLDIIDAFEPRQRDSDCLLEKDCPRCHGCRLKRLFDEVEQTARDTFGSTSLETLAGRRAVDREFVPQPFA